MADPAASERPTPESLFVRWLADRDAGRAPPFDGLARAHPEHAAALKELHAELERVSRLATQAGLGNLAAVSISVRLTRVVGRLDRGLRGTWQTAR